MFTYQSRHVNVVDGDTIDLDIDLGFNMVRASTRVRLRGIDTHEIHFVSEDSEEYKKGMEESEFVEEWLDEAEDQYNGEYPLIIVTMKDDEKGKYGRYLANIKRRTDGRDLADALIDEFGEEIIYE